MISNRLFSLLYQLKVCLILMISNLFIVLKAQDYEHLIIYGQSLSAGNQSWPPLSTTSVDGNYMIGNQVWINYGNSVFNKLNPLIANISFSSAELPKTRDSYIYAECALVAGTNHLQLKTGGLYKFIATSCGTGSKTIEELSKEYYNPFCYGDFLNAIQYASIIVPGVHCPALFWMQGEQNYTVPSVNEGLTKGSIPCSDKETYKSLLMRLKRNMQTDVMNQYNQNDAPLFITYQAGEQYTRGKELAIGMAQLEASNESEDIVCAGPVYPVTDRGGHLDPNGYRWFGEMLGKVFYKTKILGETFKPLQPMEISRMDDSRKLKIKFLVSYPPLVLDELLLIKMEDYGFELFLNGIKKDLQSVTVDNDCVYLTCVSELKGDVEVVYAGTNNVGHGNLRDSDPYAASSNYLDLDKKKLDGTYLFHRDASETTLRPSYEPHDAEGVIYDKPYPLYNFSVAFYYKLKAEEVSYLVPNLANGTNLNKVIENSNVKVYFEGGELKIKADSAPSRIEVLDISGKMVAVFSVGVNLGNGEYCFPLPSLSRGLYLVRTFFSQRNAASKLLLK